MLLASKILTGLVIAIHIYIVLLETVLFKTRGKKVFGLSAEKAETVAALMSNQGCYNGFLVAALLLGLMYPDAAMAQGYAVFGLACVAVAGLWGGVTVATRIVYIQTVPAVLGLLTIYLAH